LITQLHVFSWSTNVADLIDPDSPSALSGISKYFVQSNNPTSSTYSSSSPFLTVKSSNLLVYTTIEPSSSLLTSRSNY
jgi:hypothetical protein